MFSSVLVRLIYSVLFAGTIYLMVAADSYATPISTDQVFITATVPLSQQQAFAIQKDSTVVSSHSLGSLIPIGSTINFTATAKALQERPLANQRISLRATSDSGKQSLDYDTTTNTDGVARFSLPISIYFTEDTFAVVFVIHYADQEVPLAASKTIHLQRQVLGQQSQPVDSDSQKSTFSQENSSSNSYSNRVIFAKLEVRQKTDAVTTKKLEIPVSLIAAARDGPVV